MPFIVDQLISEHQKLISVQREDSVNRAMELMVDHDFSQLPVVASDERLLGMVTSGSILDALKYFKTTVDELQVAHAMVAADIHRLGDDLFDLLDDLRDAYAVVIVDGSDKVVGVVTSYDAMEYFRRRAQDMMFVEDIESALKEYISSAFIDDQNQVDEACRAAAVQNATQSDSEARKQFKKALGKYMQATGGSVNLVQAQTKAAFDSAYPKQIPKEFDDLSLGEFSQMLLHDSTWPQVERIFNMSRDGIMTLLDDVRKTRNDLFHFRGEISSSQRSLLQFCANWLNQQRPTTNTSQSSDIAVSSLSDYTSTLEAPDTDIKPEDSSIVPIEASGDSRYAPLAEYLQRIPETQNTTSMPFEQVERIIGDRLPTNARQHRSWWANDSVSHVQSQQWLDAGWRVNGVNISDQRVNFARNREREQLYIHFFSAAIADLETVENFPVKATSCSGQSWQTVAVLPRNGPQQAIFNLVFGFRGRFRVELYIDTWNQERNKRVFDQLMASKAEIEDSVGESLCWDRLDSKRACRIALYHEGSILDSAGFLESLRVWARDAMPRLYNGLAERAETALMDALP